MQNTLQVDCFSILVFPHGIPELSVKIHELVQQDGEEYRVAIKGT